MTSSEITMLVKKSSLNIGMKKIFERVVTEEDLIQFAKVSEDYNPLHMNSEVAQKHFFKERIMHGTFVDSVISAGLANHLPGPGTVLLSISIKYRKPVKIGDKLMVTLRISEFLKNNKILVKVEVNNQNNDVVSIADVVVVLITDLENS